MFSNPSISREDFMAALSDALSYFAWMDPTGDGDDTEVIFYFAKAKMIFEEYTTAVRIFEKEPAHAISCYEEILSHIDHYEKRYQKGRYSYLEFEDGVEDDDEDPIPSYEDDEDADADEDPWLEFEDGVEDDDEDPIPSYEDDEDADADADEDPWLEFEDDQDEDDESGREVKIKRFTLKNKNTGEDEEFYFWGKIHHIKSNGEETDYLAISRVLADEDDFSLGFLEARPTEGDKEVIELIGVDKETTERLLEAFMESFPDSFVYDDDED